MLDNKKKPHTFRQNNNWYMYNFMEKRTPHRSTLVTPEEISNRLQMIEVNKIYKTYSARASADFQSAYTANPKNYNKGTSFGLFNFTIEDVAELKQLVGNSFEKINKLELENRAYKSVSFTTKEISRLQAKLTKINTEQAKNLSEKLVKGYHHKKGYYRQVITGSASNTLSIATLLGGLFLGTLAKFPTFDKSQGATDAMNYLAFALACAGLLIAIPKFFLEYNIQATTDKEERKKQYFKSMEELKERLPTVIQEIKGKEKTITALAKFFKKYGSPTAYGKQAVRSNLSSSSSTLFNASQRDELFENLALALDRKDDLATYEKVFNALTELKNLSRFNEDASFSNTLRLLLYGYLKKEFYEKNIVFFDSCELPTSVTDLIREASKNIRSRPTVNNTGTENLPQANTLINVSQAEEPPQEDQVTQQEQALTQTKIYDYFIDIMQDCYHLLAAQQLLKLAKLNDWNELDVISVFASLDSTFIDYKALATNIKALDSEPAYLSRLVAKIEGNGAIKFDNLKETEQVKRFKKILKVLTMDNVIDKHIPNQHLLSKTGKPIVEVR